MKKYFFGCLAVAAASLVLAPLARAFPPAPDGIIYGQVKDQFGTPLSIPGSMVKLQTSSGAVVSAPIQANLAIGVNYLLRVPMDANVNSSNSLTMGTAYTLYVTANSAVNLPLEMAGTLPSLNAPAHLTVQNLTLGTDANNDGIPDAWETNFLASVGRTNLAGINPNGVYTGDGRTLKQEYLLGNYPYNSNAFNVQIVSQQAGSATLAFTTAVGRTYTAYASPDLQNWSAVSFVVPGSGTAPQSSYNAATVQSMQIQTVQPANAPTMQFFRLLLQ